jgi:hypothetical protein
MADMDIAAVLVSNGKTNMKMSEDSPMLTLNDNTSKPMLVLSTQSISSSLSNTQPGKKNETITDKTKFIITIEVENIVEARTATEHIMKK